MKYINIQLQLMFKRKIFIVTFVVMVLFSIIVFTANCLEFFNDDITNVRAAKYLFAGSNLSFYFVEVLQLLFPFIAALPFSDSFFEEKKNRTIEFCFSRTSNNIYYFSKLVACFIGGVVIMFFPLLINMLLNFIAFPLDSSVDSTNFSYVHSYLFDNVMETGLFQTLFAENMYLYNFLYLVFLSVSSGLVAIIVYQISFLYQTKRIVLLGSFFAIYNFLILFFRLIGLDALCLDNYVFAAKFYSGQTLWGMVATFTLLVLAAFLPIPFAKRKLEDCYE